VNAEKVVVTGLILFFKQTHSDAVTDGLLLCFSFPWLVEPGFAGMEWKKVGEKYVENPVEIVEKSFTE
jgi:hypothetical protein